jgi:hypothetical protein
MNNIKKALKAVRANRAHNGRKAEMKKFLVRAERRLSRALSRVQS